VCVCVCVCVLLVFSPAASRVSYFRRQQTFDYRCATVSFVDVLHVHILTRCIIILSQCSAVTTLKSVVKHLQRIKL